MIRLAFLGCGRAAEIHAGQLQRHRRDVSLAFASRERTRADMLAARFGGRALASYDAAFASAEVDVIVILTPPAQHLELALSAAAAGKHVVLEKPALPAAADCDRLSAAAQGAGRHVFVAENYFYKPLLRCLRGLLAEQVIGEPLFVHVNAIKQQRTEGGWRDDPQQALGGALYEGGIHWVSFLSNLGLSVRRVQGFRPTPAAGSALERSMLLTFEFQEGAVGTLSYSWEVPSTARGLRLSKIYGRSGTITFESNGLWVFCHGKRTRFHVPGLVDLAGYRAMWSDFIRALKDGTEAEFTLRHARRDLELVEQAYASARDGGGGSS